MYHWEANFEEANVTEVNVIAPNFPGPEVLTQQSIVIDAIQSSVLRRILPLAHPAKFGSAKSAETRERQSGKMMAGCAKFA